LVLLAMLLAGSVLGQGIDGKWWKRPRIAQALELTDDQAAALEKIFARSKPKLIDLRADFEKKQFDYEQAMLEEDTDRKALEQKIEARELARAAMQTELSLMELDMKQVLKPEQRERLAQMRENARRMQQERRRRQRDQAPGDEDLLDPTPARRNGRVATPRPS
jgi:Spy/CpxP family protein refolding chaperone